MADMIENYQEETAIKEAESEPADQNFATIGEVFEDGVSLIFDGTEAASTKHYKVNTAIVFKADDRVRIIKDSGTYIVEYAIGAPLMASYADDAGNVTTSINSKLISDIFEADGLKVKSATTADAALKLLNVAGDTDYIYMNASHQLIQSNALVTFDIGNIAFWFGTGYFKNLSLGGNNSYNILVNTARELKPSSTSATYPCYLGTDALPWHYGYIGSNTALIGTETTSKIGFYGTTPIIRQTLGLTSNNMGYSSVTAANYLFALNNLIGILKAKYGLIL
jgi:hypothetical protein